MITSLFVACLDLDGRALLPAVLPGLIGGGIPAVYLDGDYAVHCAACASLPDVRPFIASFDAADCGDECSICGCSFGVEVCHEC